MKLKHLSLHAIIQSMEKFTPNFNEPEKQIDPIPSISEQKELNTVELLQEAIRESEKIEIHPEDKNQIGQLLAYPDGPVSNLENELYWKIARTDSFKKWFGDWQKNPEECSKIVDKNGEPLIMYHATREVFDEFDPKKINPLMAWVLTLGSGSYFSQKTETNYGNIFYTCFLNVKKPIDAGDKKLFNFNQLGALRNIYFSLIRPKNMALYEKNNQQEDIAGNISQIAVLHKKDIMILPSETENPHKKEFEKWVEDSLKKDIKN